MEIVAPPYNSNVRVVRGGLGDDLTLTVSLSGSDEYLQLDAQTGAILHNDVTDGYRPVIDEILASLTIGPIDPGAAVWPYSDTGRPEETLRFGAIEVVEPPPAAGIVPMATIMEGGGNWIGFHNGRSTVNVNTITGSVVPQATHVYPEDQAAFERLFVNVEIMIPKQEAQPAEPVPMRLGNVTILTPSRETGIYAMQFERFGQSWIEVLSPALGVGILIDATNGSILRDTVSDNDDVSVAVRSAFDAIIGTMTVEFVAPVGVWPYSDVLPATEPFRFGRIEFPEPEPESGIRVGAATIEGGNDYLFFRNERSILRIDPFSGVVLESTLHPVDEVAFSRLVDAIRIIPY